MPKNTAITELCPWGGVKLSKGKPFGKFLAFTLAEVLITLGIIGIVAAMTIPTLITRSQQNQVITHLQKFYSTLTNALNRSTIENGDMETWNIPETQNDVEQMITFVKQYLSPYLQGRICYYRTDGEICSKAMDNFKVNEPVFILADGSCFNILKGGGDSKSGWIHIFYDINCAEKPNVYNRDKFSFTLFYSQNISFKLKIGSTTTFKYDNPTREELLNICKQGGYGNEGSCGALIQYDGWQIKDDYPW
ncbi:type II secretion system protein [bacterium]|nr:type II secretion system protein [bacterium]